MASPVVTNTSAQLDGASLVYGFATTLTNAQTIALPTTPVQILAAPGVGFRINIINASFAVKAAAGAYTNIDTTYAALALTHSDKTDLWLTAPVVNDNTTPLAQLTAFLGTAANAVYTSPAYTTAFNSGAASGGSQYVTGLTIPLWTSTANLGVYLSIDNSAAGVLTGGNVANHLIVTIYYAVEAIS